MIGSHITIDGEAIVTLERDKMGAYLEVTAPVGNGKPCTLEKALNALQDNQVVFGVDANKVKECLQESNWGKSILVAEGKEPVHGVDAKIEYRFPTAGQMISLKIDETGKVNYHDLGLIYNVKAGDILAIKTPGAEGQAGMDVLGQELLPRKGKDPQLLGGKNTVLDPTGQYIFAQGDGHVCFMNNRVEVSPVFEVNGNVDYASGNVDFLGTVRISGTVTSGFRVKAGGDVEIGGSIEGAEVTATGNIMVKGGITGGSKGVVKAGGSIYTRFAENAHLEAGHYVMAREAIMQSKVKAGIGVKVTDKKAIIVGGTIQASREVESKVLGSQLATQTIVEVGINPHYREEYQQLIKDRVEKRKLYENINHNLQVYQKTKMSPDQMSDKQKMALLKLLDYYKSLRQELNDMEKRIETLEDEFEKTQLATVRALDIVYPGVRISIGKSIYIVNDPVKYSSFMLDQGEIRVSSLR